MFTVFNWILLMSLYATSFSSFMHLNQSEFNRTTYVYIRMVKKIESIRKGNNKDSSMETLCLGWHMHKIVFFHSYCVWNQFLVNEFLTQLEWYVSNTLTQMNSMF